MTLNALAVFLIQGGVLGLVGSILRRRSAVADPILSVTKVVREYGERVRTRALAASIS